jgi:quercetin dioxygenase-like cupin family protein
MPIERFRLTLAIIGSTLLTACGRAAASHNAVVPSASREIAWSRELPAMHGERLRVHVLEVLYEPNERSRPHSHPCATFGHVLEGALRMRVDAGPDTVYRTGDTFYEAPNSRHLVSANASSTERARFVVFFLCEGEQPLSVPLPPADTSR